MANCLITKSNISKNNLNIENGIEAGIQLKDYVYIDSEGIERTYSGGSSAYKGAIALGNNVTASGNGSFAEGGGTRALGDNSHAEGGGTTASGMQSHSEGGGTTASGSWAHAEGAGTRSSGEGSHSEGFNTSASNKASHAEGQNTSATGEKSHAEGSGTKATGESSHAEGDGTVASSAQAHAEGKDTTASSAWSHAEGYSSRNSSTGNPIEITIGNVTYAAEAGNVASHIEGYQTGTTNMAGHAEGYSTYAGGSQPGSHAEGYETLSTGGASHSEGYNTLASGHLSHAEGSSTVSSGSISHAEGYSTTASGTQSHAEGNLTESSGSNSHAEGVSTVASGYNSHAEGASTVASGTNSHAEGTFTIANKESLHVFGKYNIQDPGTSIADQEVYAEIVGNGTANNARSNARTLDWNGNESLAGSLTLGKGTNDETTISASELSDIKAGGPLPVPTVADAGKYLKVKNDSEGVGWDVGVPDSADIPYDNTSSGLEATNLQDAIDEAISLVPDGLLIMSYGHSTFAEILSAYNRNLVVYCKAASGSNPGSGVQSRMAFLAYVNFDSNSQPQEFEFQYYRTLSSHTYDSQGDEVYIYKCNKNTGWSVTTRKATTKLIIGEGLQYTYVNGGSASMTITNPVTTTWVNDQIATAISGAIANGY